MNHHAAILHELENVGSLDRVNRVITGMTLIAAAVLFTAIPASAVIGMVTLGIYAGLTAFIGWDPLYSLARAVRPRGSAPTPSTPVTIVDYRRRGARSADGAYKQAA